MWGTEGEGVGAFNSREISYPQVGRRFLKNYVEQPT